MIKIKIKTGDQIKVISGDHKGSEGKVVKIFRKSQRKEIIERNLTRSEAQRLVQSFPDKNNSMVVFYKQFTADKYYI